MLCGRWGRRANMYTTNMTAAGRVRAAGLHPPLVVCRAFFCVRLARAATTALVVLGLNGLLLSLFCSLG